MTVNIHFRRDPTYGFDEIPNDEEFAKVTTVPIEAYKEIPIEEKTCTYRGVIIYLKGKIINPASLSKLKTKYGDITLRGEIIYEVPELRVDEKFIYLPKTAHLLLEYYNEIVNNMKFNLDIEPKIMAYWLSIFCLYGPEFCATYDEYISKPDEVVGIIEGDEQYSATHYKTKERKSIATKFDLKATVHLILISMHKSFAADTAERDRQMKTYMKNRKSAVYSSMGSPIGELFLPDEFFFEISSVFQILPKLRKMLFYFCYQNQVEPEFGTACVLLAHTAMTTIKTILDFINLPQKTMAHSDPIMLEEIHKFLDITRKKKDKDGALWPYHRILYAADGDLNAANFPNLAVCSIEYHKKYGSQTFKFMVTPSLPVIPNIIDKALEYDKRDIYTQIQEKELSENAKLGAKELGLDVSKLTGTRAAQERAGVKPELIQALKDLLSM